MEVRAAAATGFVVGFKLYPAGATTISASGVTYFDMRFDKAECGPRAGSGIGRAVQPATRSSTRLVHLFAAADVDRFTRNVLRGICCQERDRVGGVFRQARTA